MVALMPRNQARFSIVGSEGKQAPPLSYLQKKVLGDTALKKQMMMNLNLNNHSSLGAWLLRMTLASVLLLSSSCVSLRPTRTGVGLPIHLQSGDHSICLLDQGSEALLARVHLIREAQTSVDLQTFIYTNDRSGRLITYELLMAALRGVRCQILVDQIFSEVDADLLAYVAGLHPNLVFKIYNPVSHRLSPNLAQSLAESLFDPHRLNQRMHNKVMIVDGKTAIVGGRNIEDTYFDLAKGMNFRDRELVVRGPVLDDIARSFDNYWKHPLAVSCMDLIDVRKKMVAGASRPTDLPDTSNSPLRQLVSTRLQGFDRQFEAKFRRVERVAFLADVPGKNDGNGFDDSSRMNEQLVGLTLTAKKELLIQSPYFVLTKRATKLFSQLNQKGIRMTVSTNSLAATDNWTTYGIFHRQKRRLVHNHDLQLYEYKPLPDSLRNLWPDYDRIKQQMQAHSKKGSPSNGSSKASTDLTKVPYFCLHAKSLVIDSKIACVGSYNLDPRSANLNTEVALVVEDDAFAKELTAVIHNDIAAGNSWLVAKQYWPRPLKPAVQLLEHSNELVFRITTIDLLPNFYTTNYALREGETPVPCNHADFYNCYHRVGNFPMVPSYKSKSVLARLTRLFGSALMPIL
jgi:phosphatidylserine/phosphatidylglycerophosphate/cardiolipin synthase-like enzyme